MSDHGDTVASRDGEADVEQDLPFALIGKAHIPEFDARRPGREFRRARAVRDLAVLGEEAKHAVHVEQRLLDLAVHHAEEVERDVELDQQAVNQHQVAESEALRGNAFGHQQHQRRHRNGDDQALADVEASLGLLNIGQSLIIAVAVTALMLLVAEGVAAQSFTLGDLVLVNGLLIQLYIPLNFLGMVYREIKQALLDMDRMFRLLAEHREVEDRPGAPELPPGPARVEWLGVDFYYEPARQILHDVSLVIEAGHRVAVVGHSGSGKSTLARLLYRFYDVSGGEILVNGHDVREVKQASLRAAIGIVPQDTVLFNDSILYNIRYGRPKASDAEVIEAARAAHIHDFIESLPRRYETMVGERGLKLSGGEKQRVAIARALLKNPRILIFDEATSALDSRAEKAIQAELERISQGRTTLVIAHRLSTVMDADQILVLSHGRVSERGTHRQLLEAKGEYARMWALQQQKAQAEAVLAQAEAS